MRINKCDECGTVLEKVYVLTEFNIPFVAWVCPKSELYQQYKTKFDKKYTAHKQTRERKVKKTAAQIQNDWRKTPEGRAKYNEYMRNYQRRRAKANNRLPKMLQV